MRLLTFVLSATCWLPAVCTAGMVEIVDVALNCAETCRFDVTLRHSDSGWDHYADKWQVLGPDGAVLGTRVLHHPHVEEQPFTRSLAGVLIPPKFDEVWIRAFDSVHGRSDQDFRVTLPDR